ncbi:MAG: F0F1 ATP synthase subunit B [Burkholderiaceae bacterium]
MSFDWTSFAFQLVNVVILLAILRRFLFRPVADVIARRQAATDAALAAADEAKARAEAASAKADQEARANAAARQDVLARARAEADAQRTAALEQARTEAAKIVADGRSALDKEKADAQALAVGRARDLAMTIARRALDAQPATPYGYVERLVSALRAMAPAEREALLAGAGLRLVAPAALPADAAEKARAALSAFGVEPDVDVDPSLIAGLELRSASGALRNSLAHDLDRIAEAMRDDRAG